MAMFCSVKTPRVFLHGSGPALCDRKQGGLRITPWPKIEAGNATRGHVRSTTWTWFDASTEAVAFKAHVPAVSYIRKARGIISGGRGQRSSASLPALLTLEVRPPGRVPLGTAEHQRASGVPGSAGTRQIAAISRWEGVNAAHRLWAVSRGIRTAQEGGSGWKLSIIRPGTEAPRSRVSQFPSHCGVVEE